MKTNEMTPAEHEAWLARWSPPFCVTCEVELTAAEREHPRNSGDFDEICDACVARERTTMTETAQAETVAKSDETETLVAAMEQLPAYQGWRFSYEYPGFFCFSHPDNSFSVFCTPDWEGAETLPIEVQTDDGDHCEEHSDQLPLPREGRTAQKIFELVRPTLDKLLAVPQPAAPPTVDLHVSLTAEEIDALQKACSHVRVHMAHEHTWAVRDAAMGAISKVLDAARKASS